MTNINPNLGTTPVTTAKAATTTSTTTNSNVPADLPAGTYVITTPDNGGSWATLTNVNWDYNNMPPYIYCDGRLFKYLEKINSSEFQYEDVNYKNTGRGRIRIGYLTDPEYVQTGTTTKRVQVGEKDVVVGYKDVVTGTEQVKTGEKDVITGYKDVVTGTEQVKTGERDVITGYKDVVTGTEQVKTGEKDVITGYKDVKTGTEQVQTGEKKVITGYKDVKTGTRQVQTGEKTVTDTKTTVHNLKVSRELDGKNDTGAVGDMLTRGTAVLNDAGQFFVDGKFQQYQVSSLTGENNQAVSSNAKLSVATDASGNTLPNEGTVLGRDDMYVAGDPLVGGKGNQYQAVSVTPDAGYMTMFEDGLDNGRKVTINSHPQVINDLGNKAFTEYGFVVQDDAGKKTTAALSGGQLTITDPDGKQTKLLPGQEYVVGAATDPVAKFYYKSMPGGENGTNEQRLVFDYYEKLTPETKAALVAQGVPAGNLDSLRSINSAAFGFRVPDGAGSYRMSSGVGNGAALPVTSNNVKTYYDAHFYEPENVRLNYNTTETTYHTEPVYETQDIIEKQPIYGKEPIYETRDITEKQPIYGKEPIYETRDVTEKQPIYGKEPIYETRDITEKQPIYGKEPIYETRNITEKQPIYGKEPIYNTVEEPVYGYVRKAKYRFTSPLAADLGGDGLQTTDVKKIYDLDGDGVLDKTAWLGQNEGVFAFDSNNNGKAGDSGLELFGDVTDIDGDGKLDGFLNGFEALSSFAKQKLGGDSVSDMKLDEAEIKDLEDNAGLRMLVGDKTVKPSDFGIIEINLDYADNDATVDENGNEHRQKSSFVRRLDDGTTMKGALNDIWLQMQSGAESDISADKPDATDTTPIKTTAVPDTKSASSNQFNFISKNKTATAANGTANGTANNTANGTAGGGGNCNNNNNADEADATTAADAANGTAQTQRGRRHRRNRANNDATNTAADVSNTNSTANGTSTTENQTTNNQTNNQTTAQSQFDFQLSFLQQIMSFLNMLLSMLFRR